MFGTDLQATDYFRICGEEWEYGGQRVVCAAEDFLKRTVGSVIGGMSPERFDLEFQDAAHEFYGALPEATIQRGISQNKGPKGSYPVVLLTNEADFHRMVAAVRRNGVRLR
jgi:hypothetical protein